MESNWIQSAIQKNTKDTTVEIEADQQLLSKWTVRVRHESVHTLLHPFQRRIRSRSLDVAVIVGHHRESVHVGCQQFDVVLHEDAHAIAVVERRRNDQDELQIAFLEECRDFDDDLGQVELLLSSECIPDLAKSREDFGRCLEF